MPFSISRSNYARVFGPTVGDSIRLADTELFIQIEADFLGRYGDEVKFGGGKVIRDGMGQHPFATSEDVPDTVITNCVIFDAFGVIKADIAIKDGNIVKIGAAGNPLVMDGKSITIGASTEVIAGEGLIVTPGGVDAHIHFISPTQIETALYSGITTMIGGGTGPSAGTRATTCTPGRWHLERMMIATAGYPMNFGFLGKGNSSGYDALAEQIQAGALGLKLHEDWGSTHSAINMALTVADDYDVQVAIHTDTLNEFGFLEETVAAIAGRTIHTYHTEGAGGGHAPDIIKIASYSNVLPSSTNPTRPYTANTVDEHLDMLMVCHHLDPRVVEDLAFADSRIRAETIAAEDVLHDLGVISMISSDSQAMGRVGEVILRTWQSASKMKEQRGTLSGDSQYNDNERAKRYIAKYTINPAIAHGVDSYVGSISVGKLADLVLWKPAFFGVKPEMVIKGGQIAYSLMGDANASIPTPEPQLYRPMFGAQGSGPLYNSFTFVSSAFLQGDLTGALADIKSRFRSISSVRSLSKKNMIRNDSTPEIKVDPQTYEVLVDGVAASCEPAVSLPMARRYFLF